ncbi:9733_t:CDS:10, partial [Acaulospora colombiana]
TRPSSLELAGYDVPPIKELLKSLSTTGKIDLSNKLYIHIINQLNMSSVQETYGKGGAGNVSRNVNHAIEEVEAHIPTENTAGRGGYGNIQEGPGHYDYASGHAGLVDTTGRGGLGNLPEPGTHATTGTTEGTAPFKAEAHKEQKVTAADKVIGSAQIAIGKVTKITGLIEKGTERKTEGSLHSTAPVPPSAAHSGAPQEYGTSTDLKNSHGGQSRCEPNRNLDFVKIDTAVHTTHIVSMMLMPISKYRVSSSAEFQSHATQISTQFQVSNDRKSPDYPIIQILRTDALTALELRTNPTISIGIKTDTRSRLELLQKGKEVISKHKSRIALYQKLAVTEDNMELHPISKAILGSINVLYQRFEEQEQNNEFILQLVDNIASTIGYMEDVEQFARISQLRKAIEDTRPLIEETINFILRYTSRSGI